MLEQISYPLECRLRILHVVKDERLGVEYIQRVPPPVPDGYGAGFERVHDLLRDVPLPVSVLHDDGELVLGHNPAVLAVAAPRRVIRLGCYPQRRRPLITRETGHLIARIPPPVVPDVHFPDPGDALRGFVPELDAARREEYGEIFPGIDRFSGRVPHPSHRFHRIIRTAAHHPLPRRDGDSDAATGRVGMRTEHVRSIGGGKIIEPSPRNLECGYVRRDGPLKDVTGHLPRKGQARVGHRPLLDILPSSGRADRRHRRPRSALRIGRLDVEEHHSARKIEYPSVQFRSRFSAHFFGVGVPRD
mmetsp:Transcript_45938/g.139505  ORF Transcript_45938/g.139505 Transcript_45938/m.139505 type:complete len:303 (-) Transcript_45938:286-1194(-)